ncbi:DUF7683 domain-containing protein [Mucilaginibacter sp. McL0603]|uniref:DUF7683 domain-containing protein n=1 Tax=Mucilaginibacter sp. McL0603 TaxID=3415670 RepID=UPI003CF66222
MKLISVERSLQVFDKKSEELVIEYAVTLDLDSIIKIVKPLKSDPKLYRPYALSQLQIKKLLAKINLDLIMEMKTYHYFLDCSGIYDWDK